MEQARAICKPLRQDVVEGTWSDAGTEHQFHVRGPFYMSDRLKVHPGPAVCSLLLYVSSCVMFLHGQRCTAH